MPRIRLVFSKSGFASFISHQDLPELFSRAARRAELVCEWTQGFSPHPHLVIGPPLPMSVQGEQEPAEFWFEQWGEDSLARWNEKLIDGLELLRAKEVDGLSLAKLCEAAEYRIAVRGKTNLTAVASGLKAIMGSGDNLLFMQEDSDAVTLCVKDIERCSAAFFVRGLTENAIIEGWRDLSMTRLCVGKWNAAKHKIDPLVETTG